MASREIHTHVMRLLRPLSKRLTNMALRTVVQLVDDAKKLQLLQVGANGEVDADEAEHHQPYGFSSVPLKGAEAIMLFPNGDQEHALAIAVSDRRYRPTGGVGGEVCMYTDEGDIIKLGRGRVMTLTAGTTLKLGGTGAVDAAIKGTTRNTAEQTFLTALAAYATAIKAIADPSNTATPALTTAITAFATALASTLSVKVKIE